MSKIKAILNGIQIGLFITFSFLTVSYFVHGNLFAGVLEALCALLQLICLLRFRRPKAKVKVIELSDEQSKEFLKKIFEELEENQEEKEE